MTITIRGTEREGQTRPPTGIAGHSEGTGRSTGNYAHAEGYSTTSSNEGSHAEGLSTVASGYAAHAEGSTSTASAYYSHAGGNWAQAPRVGQWARGMYHQNYANIGQNISLSFGAGTTNATVTPMMCDGSAVAVLTAGSINVLTLAVKTSFHFRIECIAKRDTTGYEAAGFFLQGVVTRDATGNARIIGTPTYTTWADAGATTWAVTLSINTTNATLNYLQINVTGEASKSIAWIAGLYATELQSL